MRNTSNPVEIKEQRNETSLARKSVWPCRYHFPLGQANRVNSQREIELHQFPEKYFFQIRSQMSRRGLKKNTINFKFFFFRR